MIQDGSVKYVTLDCAGCPFHLHGPGANRLLAAAVLPKKHQAIADSVRRFCIWGATIKTLVPSDKPRACGIRRQDAPGAQHWIGLVAHAEHAGEAQSLPGVSHDSEP